MSRVVLSVAVVGGGKKKTPGAVRRLGTGPLVSKV